MRLMIEVASRLMFLPVGLNQGGSQKKKNQEEIKICRILFSRIICQLFYIHFLNVYLKIVDFFLSLILYWASQTQSILLLTNFS